MRFGFVASERIGPAQSQARQCPRRAAPGYSAMVDKLLNLRYRRTALVPAAK